MTEQPYRTGELLTVTERNVRVVRTERDPEFGLVVVVDQRMRGGSDRERLVFPDAPSTTVDRVTPADGIPRPGQIWGDQRGGEYFAAPPSPGSRSEVHLIGSDGSRENWRILHVDRVFGPLHLVRDVPTPASTPKEGP